MGAWRRACGVAMADRRGALLLLLVAAGSARCSSVEFVPSPYSPQNVVVTYAPDEDLTVVRWSVECTDTCDEAVFELQGRGGEFAPVRFDRAPYPSGTYPCEQGTCAQLAVRGRLSPGRAATAPVRARHPDLGVLRGGKATELTVGDPLTIEATFTDDNRRLRILARDRLLGGGLPRPLAYSLWESRAGDCEDAGRFADDVGLLDGGRVEVPIGSAGGGRFCVAVHGVPRDAARERRVTALALAWPELEAREVAFTPQSRPVPLLVQTILDLGELSPEECQLQHDLWLGSLRRLFFSLDSGWVEFPVQDLAPTCVQGPDRRLDVELVTLRITQEIFARSPPGTGIWHRAVVLYINSATERLPGALVEDLRQLSWRADAILGSSPTTFMWGIVDEVATPDEVWHRETPWTGALERLGAIAAETLPLHTVATDGRPFELMTPDEVQREAGALVKSCRAELPTLLALGEQPAGTPTVPIVPFEPPGVFVTLPRQVAPRGELAAQQVVVPFEICRRFCDHPFVAANRIVERSWRESAQCARDR